MNPLKMEWNSGYFSGCSPNSRHIERWRRVRRHASSTKNASEYPLEFILDAMGIAEVKSTFYRSKIFRHTGSSKSQSKSLKSERFQRILQLLTSTDFRYRDVWRLHWAITTSRQVGEYKASTLCHRGDYSLVNPSSSTLFAIIGYHQRKSIAE